MLSILRPLGQHQLRLMTCNHDGKGLPEEPALVKVLMAACVLLSLVYGMVTPVILKEGESLATRLIERGAWTAFMGLLSILLIRHAFKKEPKIFSGILLIAIGFDGLYVLIGLLSSVLQADPATMLVARVLGNVGPVVTAIALIKKIRQGQGPARR